MPGKKHNLAISLFLCRGGEKIKKQINKQTDLVALPQKKHEIDAATILGDRNADVEGNSQRFHEQINLELFISSAGCS